MKSLLMLSLVFSTGFEANSEHMIEIATPTRLLMGGDCDPEYSFGVSGGTIAGNCNWVTSQDRTQKSAQSQSKSYGGDSIVQLANYPGFTFTDCQLIGMQRSVFGPGLAQTLYSFTCEEN